MCERERERERERKRERERREGGYAFIMKENVAKSSLNFAN